VKGSTQESTINAALADELWLEFYTKKGLAWLAVRTGSMVPLIRPGDSVLISKAAADQIRPGDVVIFRRGEDMIVHRVLKKLHNDESLRFLEKGDNSGVCRTFGTEDVIGKAIMVKGRSKIFYLVSPVGRSISGALSVCFYWSSAIVRRLRDSSHRNIRRAGKVLLLISLLSSNILVRICCIVWYLSGIKYRRSADLGW
jgi:signal peptidase I